ncbi:protein NLRC3-like [Hoplias malabaricus]|uniref:protein NLRC3-like n=1 Tax=Hoplias malabaricus TaxID=27720 RepID=UPI003463366F
MSITDKLQSTLEELVNDRFDLFKRHLNQGVRHYQGIPKSQLEDAKRWDTVDAMVNKYGPDEAMEITQAILRKMNENQLAKELMMFQAEISSISPACSAKDAYRQEQSHKLKTIIKHTAAKINEGFSVRASRVALNDVYIELYAVEGWTGGVSMEHEFIKLEAEFRRCSSEDTPIEFTTLFQSNSKVLTIGIAGVGKTVAVQKFALDWANEICAQNMDFVFLIPFRELNLIQEEERSFQDLLLYFYPELVHLKGAGLFGDECTALFILDGLDEFRVPLNFDQKRLSDVTQKAKVDVLITNLIKGHLLRSALIWITSRPATADQIPLDNIDRVTEVRGFSHEQRENFFRKKLKEKSSRVISHVRDSRSLHIMCHLPVFCWMMVTVLQPTLGKKESEEIPQTLTEMYIHFLLIQANINSHKYDETHQRDTKKLLKSNSEVILQLAELAFKQLMKGHVIFYEEDLMDCGVDISERSIYFGICSEFFLEESAIYQRKVYCFVHLSFQEFLAAFYVFHCYVTKDVHPLKCFISWSKEGALHELLCSAVQVYLRHPSLHLDLFLRFLLGISLESNQRFLQGLLPHTKCSAESTEKTVQFIKDQIYKEDLPADKSLNLCLCLREMNDCSLYNEVCTFLSTNRETEEKLSTAHCSAIAHVLHMERNVLKELNPRKYSASLEGCMRLMPAARKALLACCGLTNQSCNGILPALQHLNSPLRELDLTNNDLQDSGVKLLCTALQNSHCKLEILKLSGCMITNEGCASLASALKSNPSHLRELDLSYNNPGETGVMRLLDLQEDTCYRLEKLDVDHRGEFRIKPGLKKYACLPILDETSKNIQLSVSGQTSWVAVPQEDPLHPERSVGSGPVVCAKCLSGRCYWELECTEGEAVEATHNGILGKEGTSSRLVSWSLACAKDRYILREGDQRTEVPALCPHSYRVGVYLDWGSETLSFYSLSSQTPKHIHTFHCSFTEPQCAEFGLDARSSVALENVQ